MATIDSNLTVQGDLIVTGAKPASSRTDLTQESNAKYPVKLTDLRVHDAPQTVLPGTSSGNDLALVGTTFGTDTLAVQTADLKAAGATTDYARFTFQLPHNYVSGETVTLRIHALMNTTPADVSAAIDAEAYLSDDEGAKTGSDLVTTSAQSMNSLTGADYDFNLTATSLVPGSTIDIRIATAVNDAATGTAVIARVGAVTMLLDVKG